MQTDRGVVRRGGNSERSPMLDQRMKQNKREKRRVKEIAEWYKNLAICQGWKGQRRPQKLDILTKTIEYVKKLQEHKGSQVLVMTSCIFRSVNHAYYNIMYRVL